MTLSYVFGNIKLNFEYARCSFVGFTTLSRPCLTMDIRDFAQVLYHKLYTIKIWPGLSFVITKWTAFASQLWTFSQKLGAEVCLDKRLVRTGWRKRSPNLHALGDRMKNLLAVKLDQPIRALMRVSLHPHGNWDWIYNYFIFSESNYA